MQGSLETLNSRFVTVQLTLLSIAVALILESLLSVMLAMSEWSALVVMQALEIAVSAISMWVGFALGISTSTKPPHLMDFLVHFLLLFTLSTAVYFISAGNLPGYFVAGGLGTTSAAACLWLDVRITRRAGVEGPVGTARLLTIVALLEFSLAGLTGQLAIDSAWVAPMIVPSIALQAFAAYRSMRFWQGALA